MQTKNKGLFFIFCDVGNLSSAENQSAFETEEQCCVLIGRKSLTI